MPSAEVEVDRERSFPAGLVALIFPDRGMPRVAKSSALRGPLVVAVLCALLAGGAAALRVDARSTTLQALEKGGQLGTMSDRQIDEARKAEERAFVVRRIGAAAAEVPISLGLHVLSLLALAWFLRGRVRGKALLPVAGVALLPGAIADALDAAAALLRESVSPRAAHLVPRTLADLFADLGHPLSGPLALLAQAPDFFSLWSAILVGVGLSQVAGLRPRLAFWTTLAGWGLFRLTVCSLGGLSP